MCYLSRTLPNIYQLHSLLLNSHTVAANKSDNERIPLNVIKTENESFPSISNFLFPAAMLTEVIAHKVFGPFGASELRKSYIVVLTQ